MPIYEYRCKECEQIFEEWQKDFEATEAPCPVCGGVSERIISHTSFVLKGTGWYTTDYSRAGGNGGAAKCETPQGASSPSGGDAASGSSDSGSGSSDKSAATPPSGGQTAAA